MSASRKMIWGKDTDYEAERKMVDQNVIDTITARLQAHFKAIFSNRIIRSDDELAAFVRLG